MPPALRLLFLAHAQNSGPGGDFPRVGDYFAAIEHALFGDDADPAAGSAGTGTTSGCAKREFWLDGRAATPPDRQVPVPTPDFLDSALHSLVIALVTAEFAADEAAVRGLEALARAIQDSNGRP